MRARYARILSSRAGSGYRNAGTGHTRQDSPLHRRDMAPPPPLYILTGPTAVGKTELSLAAAKALGAEILSCDALCVYRSMDIGTAKPTASERAQVPHHGIDLVEVHQRYSIGQYVEEARAAVEAIHGRQNRVLISGGSGFYLKSFFAPVVDEIMVPTEIRVQVEHLLAVDGLEAAGEALRVANGGRLPPIDLKNPRRVARALERCLASGKSWDDLTRDFHSRQSPFAAHPKIAVQLDRTDSELRERIAARTGHMLAAGLVEEVEALRLAGLEKNPTARSAIGYREVLSYLEGELSLDSLPALIAQNTWRLVKKQRTWFRTQIPITRVAHPDEVSPATLFD